MPVGPRTAGIDLGGTKLLALAIDGDGTVEAEHRVPTPEGGDALIAAFASAVEQLIASGPIEAVGVGAPGLVDRTGTLRTAPNLPGVEDLAVRSRLQDRLRLPVQVDNDVTCAAWAERELGAGRGGDDVHVVALGTGIGGGSIRHGRHYRAAHGRPGES